MSNYTKTVDFAAKDALATGSPGKIIKGTEINTEFVNIATAVSSKLDSSGAILTDPVFSGTVTGTALIDGGTY